MPSARKRSVHLAVGGSERRPAAATATGSSAASTGVRPGLNISAATAENDRARTVEGPHRRLISAALHSLRSFGHFCVVVELGTP